MGHIRCSAIIPAGRSEVFDFLTDPKNLPDLLAEHIEVDDQNEGRAIARDHEFIFSMTRLGFSQPVRLKVTELIPGDVMIYRQTEGLFQKWAHTMKFEDHGPEQTLVTDLVEYQMPAGFFGHLIDDLFVRRDMSKVLSDRLKKTEQHFISESESEK